MSDKKWLKDPPAERLVKCYACDGKGCVESSYAYTNGFGGVNWSPCFSACKECGGYGSVVLNPIDQAPTFFDSEDPVDLSLRGALIHRS